MNEWLDAERFAEQAHRYFEAGHWDKALRDLKRALEIHPDQTDWLMGLGLTLDELGRYEEAVTAYQRIISLAGNDVDTLLNLSMDLIRLHRPREALGAIDRLELADGLNHEAWCQRIAAHGLLDEHDKAETAFYMAVQLDEHSAVAYDHIAASLAMRGEVDRAVWCWQRTIDIDPYFPDAYANLARLHWQRGQYERARQLFLDQLRADPGNIAAILDFGQLLIDMGRNAEAGEKFRRVLELDTTIAEAHLRLGQLALLENHLDAAMSEFKLADRLDPARAGVQLGMARIARHRGRTGKTRQHLHAELERHGRTIDESLDLAEMLLEFQMADAALTVLDPVLENVELVRQDAGLHSEALMFRGVARLMRGEREQGIRDCRAAVRQCHTNAPAMYNLVLAYISAGQLSRARYWLARALELQDSAKLFRRLQLILAYRRFRAAITRCVNVFRFKK